MINPPWLATARSLIGKVEDGPSILPLAAKIGQLYPEMASYCAQVRTTTSWCGEFVAYCLALSGIRPPFKPSVDTQSFLWALAWANWGVNAATDPQPGDVLVFDFGGGDHHVTFFDHDNGDGTWACLGGNQSDRVKLSNYKSSQCIAVRRALDATLVTSLPPAGTITAPPTQPSVVQTRITATVFGGSSDRQTSAYDGHVIGDDEVCVALPYRFTRPLPKLGVTANGNTARNVPIADVGPWNTNDPYWKTNSRPEAETGTDNTGRHTNRAGIDLSPALASQLGVDGKGLVDWWFETEAPMPTPVPAPPPPTQALPAGAPPATRPAPTPEQIDRLVTTTQALILQLAAKPQVQATTSALIGKGLSLLFAAFPQFGVWGLVASQVLTTLGVMGPAIGAGTTPTGQVVATGALGMLVSGLVSKFSTLVSNLGQRPPAQ